jgi:hypothetical protein
MNVKMRKYKMHIFKKIIEYIQHMIKMKMMTPIEENVQNIKKKFNLFVV